MKVLSVLSILFEIFLFIMLLILPKKVVGANISYELASVAGLCIGIGIVFIYFIESVIAIILHRPVKKLRTITSCIIRFPLYTVVFMLSFKGMEPYVGQLSSPVLLLIGGGSVAFLHIMYRHLLSC